MKSISKIDMTEEEVYDEDVINQFKNWTQLSHKFWPISYNHNFIIDK